MTRLGFTCRHSSLYLVFNQLQRQIKVLDPAVLNVQANISSLIELPHHHHTPVASTVRLSRAKVQDYHTTATQVPSTEAIDTHQAFQTEEKVRQATFQRSRGTDVSSRGVRDWWWVGADDGAIPPTRPDSTYSAFPDPRNESSPSHPIPPQPHPIQNRSSSHGSPSNSSSSGMGMNGQPSLMRTSQLTAAAVPYQTASGSSAKASLDLQGDLNSMAVGW